MSALPTRDREDQGSGWVQKGSALSSFSIATSLWRELGTEPLQESTGALVAYLLPKQDFLLVLMHGKGTTSGIRSRIASKAQLQAACLGAAPAELSLQLWPSLQETGTHGGNSPHPRHCLWVPVLASVLA